MVRRLRRDNRPQQHQPELRPDPGRAPVPRPHRRRGLHERPARHQRRRLPHRPVQAGGRLDRKPKLQPRPHGHLLSLSQAFRRGGPLGQPLRPHRHARRPRHADHRGGRDGGRRAPLRDRIPRHGLPDERLRPRLVPGRHPCGRDEHRLRPLRRHRGGQHRRVGDAGRAGSRRRHQPPGLIRPAFYHQQHDDRLSFRVGRLAAHAGHGR